MAALKLPAMVFLLLLWLSLVFLLFHGLYGFKRHMVINSNPSSTAPRRQNHGDAVVKHRKVLASKFDFSRFRKSSAHHHHHHRRGGGSSPPEIDPRYGVDKRLVPTGPNPLHH
ncbi:unnamed protein product [Linum trigynum]|uniref:Uncharacterized protein n=1 Tax=Linum trigynum TaxID=586398 RepID=A0AAV2GCD5_9ROSI